MFQPRAWGYTRGQRRSFIAESSPLRFGSHRVASVRKCQKFDRSLRGRRQSLEGTGAAPCLTQARENGENGEVLSADEGGTPGDGVWPERCKQEAGGDGRAAAGRCGERSLGGREWRGLFARACVVDTHTRIRRAHTHTDGPSVSFIIIITITTL